MTQWERGIHRGIQKHVLSLAVAAVFLLGLFMRYSLIPLMVADMEFMNMSWYNAIRTTGMASALLPEYQWTYSPLHLYLWALAAKLLPGVPGLYVLKGVSLLMEAGMVVAFGLLLWQGLPTGNRRLAMVVGMSLLWLSPIQLLGVAGWGQTDASYAAFSLFALWFLLRDRPALAMISFGLAMAFKLQAIFLLPLFFMVYDYRKAPYSFLWFLLVPAVWIATGLPMVFLGESPLYAVNVYLGQTSLYTRPTFNCPNLYALLGDVMNNKQMILGLWQRYGLALAIAVLGGMATWLIYRQAKLSRRAVALLGAWCVLACLFFLPRMHERYGLVGETLLIIWAVLLWKPRGFLWTLLGMLPTISAYCQYMFRYPIFSLQFGAALNLILLCALTWEVVREARGAEGRGTASGGQGGIAPLESHN